ncbi:MAG TPA: hypothetical protein VFM73_03305 [Xanthomonadaceae bacterium]|nr:hypothetical protein [Xanthomonadaceae bacterium]
MSDVIGFLESLGKRPARAMQGYEAAVAALGVARPASDALLRRDAGALSTALGGRDAMWCAILSPDESPGEEQPPRREEPSRDDPQPDPEED